MNPEPNRNPSEDLPGVELEDSERTQLPIPGRETLSQAFESFFEQTLSPLNHSMSIASSIGFLGVKPKTGVTTVATYAAFYSASVLGMKTILVDANTASPAVGEKFTVASPVGFTDIVNDPEELETAVKATTVENLSVIAAGANKIASKKKLKQLPAIQKKLADLAKVVVFDLPSIRSPNLWLMRSINANVMVVNSKSTYLNKASRSASFLKSKRVSLAGVFLNEHFGTS